MSSLKTGKGYQMHFLEVDRSGRGTNINGYKGLMLPEHTSASMWDTAVYAISIPSESCTLMLGILVTTLGSVIKQLRFFYL